MNTKNFSSFYEIQDMFIILPLTLLTHKFTIILIHIRVKEKLDFTEFEILKYV